MYKHNHNYNNILFQSRRDVNCVCLHLTYTYIVCKVYFYIKNSAKLSQYRSWHRFLFSFLFSFAIRVLIDIFSICEFAPFPLVEKACPMKVALSKKKVNDMQTPLPSTFLMFLYAIAILAIEIGTLVLGVWSHTCTAFCQINFQKHHPFDASATSYQMNNDWRTRSNNYKCTCGASKR